MIHCRTYDEARMEVINIMSHYDCKVKTITINIQEDSKFERYPFVVDYEDFSEEEYENIF